MNEHLPQRKNLRLKSHDYNSDGAYFITICTKGKCVLSKITAMVGGDVLDAPQVSAIVELTEQGQIAESYIKELNDFYDFITVDKYIIMPDHIHMILLLSLGGASRTSPPTKAKPRQHSAVSAFVSTFKRFCNKKYGANVWQRSFYDECIRSYEDYEAICGYIKENPVKWIGNNLSAQN